MIKHKHSYFSSLQEENDITIQLMFIDGDLHKVNVFLGKEEVSMSGDMFFEIFGKERGIALYEAAATEMQNSTM